MLTAWPSACSRPCKGDEFAIVARGLLNAEFATNIAMRTCFRTPWQKGLTEDNLLTKS